MREAGREGGKDGEREPTAAGARQGQTLEAGSQSGTSKWGAWT